MASKIREGVIMAGKIYPNHGRGIEKLHRWFVSYEDKQGRYTEENFDLKREARARLVDLINDGLEAELWTRERAMPESRLRPRRTK